MAEKNPSPASGIDSAQGRVNREHELRHLINGLGAEKGRVVALLQQAIENADDAKATAVNITIDPKAKVFRIADNGKGIDEEDVRFLNSLFDPDDEHKSAKKGTTGQNNSGRLTNIAVSDVQQYYFKSDSYPNLHLLNFGRKQALELLDDPLHFTNPPVPVEKAPDWVSIHNTGSVLDLQQVNWNLVRTGTHYRNQLLRVLGPWMSQNVLMNNIKLPEHYPNARKFEGAEADPILGPVEYKFYELPEKQRSGQDIRLGGKNPIVSLDKFYRQAQDHHPEMTERIPLWMKGDRLAAFINVLSINKFAHHDRRSLSPELFEDNPEYLQALINMLVRIGRKAEEFYALRFDLTEDIESKLERDADLLAQLCPVDDPKVKAKDKADGPEEPPADILLAPREEMRIPGDEFEVHVRRGSAGGEWVLDPEAGTIVERDSRSIRIRVGEKLGKHKVIYKSKKGGRDVEGSMLLNVQEKREPSLTGPFRFAAPSRQRLFVKGYDHSIAKWECNNEDILIKGNGRYVDLDVQRECKPGFYGITATGEDGTKINRNIFVDAPENDHLQIDGKVYRLEPSVKGSPTAKVYSTRAKFDGKYNASGTIAYNLDSNEAKMLIEKFGRNSEAFSASLLHILAAAYCEATPTAKRELILEQLISRMPQSK